MKSIYIKNPGSRGRGVFAGENITVGDIICRDPVIVVSFDDICEASILYEYPMRWTDTENAIALGPSNLLNHSDAPNCIAMPVVAVREMVVIATRDVMAGDELTIHCSCPLGLCPA